MLAVFVNVKNPVYRPMLDMRLGQLGILFSFMDGACTLVELL